MTEIFNRYRAIGYQTENGENGVMHKVWVHGTLRASDAPGAEKCIHHTEDETLSSEAETELWFLNYVPFWIVLPVVTAR